VYRKNGNQGSLDPFQIIVGMRERSCMWNAWTLRALYKSSGAAVFEVLLVYNM